MVRPRSIDREHLLDKAEQIVTHDGAAHLSFGSLATQSGIAKASIQSAFGTREQLLEALVRRWMHKDDQRYQLALGNDRSPESHVRAHLTTTAEEAEEAGGRLASVLAAMVGRGHRSKNIADWYASRLGSLTATTNAERRRRIAYLAAEGAYYVRNMAKLEIDDECWREIFKDLESLVLDDEAPRPNAE